MTEGGGLSFMDEEGKEKKRARSLEAPESGRS